MATLSKEEIEAITQATLRVTTRTSMALREQGIRLTKEQYATLAGSIAGSLLKTYLDRQIDDHKPLLH